MKKPIKSISCWRGNDDLIFAAVTDDSIGRVHPIRRTENWILLQSEAGYSR